MYTTHQNEDLLQNKPRRKKKTYYTHIQRKCHGRSVLRNKDFDYGILDQSTKDERKYLLTPDDKFTIITCQDDFRVFYLLNSTG